MNDSRDSFSQSPMKHRVTRGNSYRGNHSGLRGFSIPKKGRIRLVLLVLLCFFGLKLLWSSSTSTLKKIKTVEPKVLIPQDVLPPVTNATKLEASQPSSPKNIKPSFWNTLGFVKKEIPNQGFTFTDCNSFLKKHPFSPDFRTAALLIDNKKYTIHSSVDSLVQRTALALLEQYHPKYGALVAMDPKTGRILALVSYTRPTIANIGDNLYVKSLFPAASVFKTVTAAAAIEKGNLNPKSILPLAGRRYTLYKFQLKEELAASNPVTLEDAYSFSINPIFGRIGVYIVGVAGLKEYMAKFGFNSPVPFELDVDNPVATINETDSTLAIAEISSGFNRTTKMSPLFGAMIAASVCENGKMPAPYFVDSISCNDTTVVYRGKTRTLRTPMKPSTSAYLQSMMSQVAHYGTAHTGFKNIRHSAQFDEMEYGGKTGSVDEESLGKIDWFIGFACHPTDKNQRIAIGVVTVHDEYWTVHSSYIAAEVFRKYIRQAQNLERVNRTETDVKAKPVS